MCWHVTIVEHTQEHKKVNFQTAADVAQLCSAVIQRDAAVNVNVLERDPAGFLFAIFF